MKSTNLFVVSFLLLLTACSPKVVTNITKTYPDLFPVDSVYVIEVGNTVPNTAETIGSVAVIDRGTSTNCRYDQVLHLAKETTGKNGGNGLVIIEHMKPSFWGSSCHQISGLMLRLSDTKIDTLNVNPLQDVINLNQAVVKERKEKLKAPSNTFEASIGYGWITSELYDLNGNSVGSKGGLEWKLGYQHLWNSGWGIGLIYSGYKLALEGGDLSLSYIAPECAWGIKSNKWILKGALGVGLFLYNDPFYKTTGVGVHATLGVEYMLSEQWGLGFSLNTVNGSLPKQDNYELKKDEHSGIARFNLLGGLRYYF